MKPRFNLLKSDSNRPFTDDRNVTEIPIMIIDTAIVCRVGYELHQTALSKVDEQPPDLTQAVTCNQPKCKARFISFDAE